MTRSVPVAVLVFPNLGDQQAFNRPVFLKYKVFMQQLRFILLLQPCAGELCGSSAGGFGNDEIRFFTLKAREWHFCAVFDYFVQLTFSPCRTIVHCLAALWAAF